MKAIEIEKKVRLEPHQIKKIEQQGRLVKQTQIQDQYFDTVDYRYTTQNIWLRQRDETFELKVGIQQQNGSVDRYEEFSDEKSILQYLKLEMVSDLPTALSQNDIFKFCSFFTQRTSYQLDEMRIDIDDANFGDLTYRVAEIEIVVSDLESIQDAEQKIFQFTKTMGIDTSIPVPAKLTYYLYCKRPDHYRALVHHKVITPIILDCIQQVRS